MHQSIRLMNVNEPNVFILTKLTGPPVDGVIEEHTIQTQTQHSEVLNPLVVGSRTRWTARCTIPLLWPFGVLGQCYSSPLSNCSLPFAALVGPGGGPGGHRDGGPADRAGSSTTVHCLRCGPRRITTIYAQRPIWCSSAPTSCTLRLASPALLFGWHTKSCASLVFRAKDRILNAKHINVQRLSMLVYIQAAIIILKKP